MKTKLLLAVILGLFITNPVFAGTLSHPDCSDGESLTGFNAGHRHCYTDTDTDTDTDTNSVYNEKEATDYKMGFKADFPNLIRLTDQATLGIEAGKDNWGTNVNEGWFTWFKFTWVGNWFDFSK